MIRTLSTKFAAVAIRRGQFLSTAVKKVHKRHKQNISQQSYHAWAVQNELRCFIDHQNDNQPLISIVVPAFNTVAGDLLSMVYSVIDQHYQNWELILVNASNQRAAKQLIDNCAEIDTRIKVIDTENKGIAGNTNIGIDQASGEYIAFLDHDDLLHACALHSAAIAIQHEGELIYSDEDKIAADNSLFLEPFYKPGWSPDLLRNVNYINHLTVIKAEYVRQAGKLRPKFDGAQDYDLLLRVIDTCQPKIVHIPRVLYHWRAAATSTAQNFDTKDNVLTAGTKAIQEHLERTKSAGRVKPVPQRPGFYAIDYPQPKKLSIIVGPVDVAYRRLCASWMEELAPKLPAEVKTEWIVGDWYHQVRPKNSKLDTELVGSSNYWSAAAAVASGDAVVCFQSGSLPTSQNEVVSISSAALALDAIVSPTIIDSQNVVLDTGLVEVEYGLQPMFYGYKLGETSYYGSVEWIRNVRGLTMQVFAASRDVFAELAEHSRDKLIPLPNTSLLHYGQAVFSFKGPFADPPLISDEYFNPQPTNAQNTVLTSPADWGSIKDKSERDYAE